MGVARFEELSGTIDGVNTIFTTSAPYAVGTTAVFINGQLKLPANDDGWTETDPATGVITLKEAPVAGDVVQAFWVDTTETPSVRISGTIRAVRLRGILTV